MILKYKRIAWKIQEEWTASGWRTGKKTSLGRVYSIYLKGFTDFWTDTDYFLYIRDQVNPIIFDKSKMRRDNV